MLTEKIGSCSVDCESVFCKDEEESEECIQKKVPFWSLDGAGPALCERLKRRRCSQARLGIIKQVVKDHDA